MSWLSNTAYTGSAHVVRGYHCGMTNRRNQPENKDPALGRAIKALRARRGISQRTAAEAIPIPVSLTAWQKWEEGRGLSPVRLQEIASVIGCTVQDILQERETSGAAPVIPITPARRFGRGQVPVFGFAAGAGERVALNDQAVIRWVEPHPAQVGYQDLGACEIIGESMWPRYKPGEIVYFVRQRLPTRGGDAVIELRDGGAIVKEYDGQRDGRVWLREYSPEERLLSFPADQVVAMHAIVGRG